MALVKCEECGREVSDKAAACVGCGAPISQAATPPQPTRIHYDRGNDLFIGTKALVVKLAVKSILEIGWKLDSADENAGVVAFTTGVTWGSWSGVSGTIYMEDLGGNKFRAVGSAKQNVRGGQIVALNIGNEAQKKADKVVETMRTLAS